MINNKLDGIFLHGWGVNNQIMNGLAASVKGLNEVVVPCLYKTARDAGSNKTEALAEALQEKTMNDAIVFAWSFGGLVATLLANKTKKIKGIVFIASPPCFVNKAGWNYVLEASAIKKLKQQLAVDTQRTLNNFAGLITHGEPEQKKMIRNLHKDISNKNNATTLSAWLDEFLEQDLRPIFSKINFPVLFLFAENDALVNVKVEKDLKALAPSASYAVIKNCGHAPFLSQPIMSAKIINKFVNEQF